MTMFECLLLAGMVVEQSLTVERQNVRVSGRSTARAGRETEACSQQYKHDDVLLR